jgi:hypothetical protein
MREDADVDQGPVLRAGRSEKIMGKGSNTVVEKIDTIK